MTTDQRACPDVETLGAFVEGTLDARRRAEVLAHLDGCGDCMAAFEVAMESVREQRSPRRWTRAIPWAAAAAAIAAIVIAVPLLRPTPMGRLVAAMPSERRTVEPRLSGGFPWAAYSSPVRTGGAEADPSQLKLHGAAGEALADPSSNEEKHAAGVALVLIDRPQDAVARLRALADAAPADARLQNDLAAAYYSAAVRLDRAALYPQALAAADRALQLDPRFAEALFNRALVLERLGLRAEARRAWEQYLAVDASSPWAVEARARLARLPAQSDASRFRELLPALEAGDRKVVARFPQQARAWAEAETLGQWAEAERKGDAATAAAKLRAARAIGDALSSTNGERLLADAVRAIESADARERAALAEGHAAYREGRMTYARRAPSEAEPLLRRAAALFASGGSPMAAVARYFAANTVFDQNRDGDARAELETLRSGLPEQYNALHAQVAWELGLCHIVAGEWSEALAALSDSAARFGRLGETSNAAFVEALQAEALASLGRPNESWAAWTAAFAKLSDQGNADRLFVALDAAARTEIDARRYDAALAMLHVQAAYARAAGNDEKLAMTLVREVLVREQSGLPSADALEQAVRAEGRISDAAMRERVGADVRLAAGIVSLRTDALRAKQQLSEAIASYESGGRPIFLPEAYLQRARAAEKTGDRAAARADLARGIDALEKQRTSGVAETGRLLYEEAIRLALDSGDAAGAFAYAERQRGGTATVAEVQRRLAGSGAALLELAVLDREVIAFAITAASFHAARTPAKRADLEALAARRYDRASLASLHELLIAPSQATLGPARELIVVAGRALESVPFAALPDKDGRYLVERFPVALAESAGHLRPSPAAVPESVVVAALPPREGAVALAAVRGETEDVAALYRSATRLDAATFPAFIDAARGGAVVHLAGHADRIAAGAVDPLLTFAANERVSWRTVARQPLGDTGVVVLAACETLRSSDAEPTGHSIASGFLAAGVREVVGTLAPIEDDAARELFLEIHRHLAAGAPASLAVQKTQLRALAVSGRRPGAWSDVASVTTRIVQ